MDANALAGWNGGTSMRRSIVALLLGLIGVLSATAQADVGTVTLTETTITWQTVAHEIDADGSIVRGSVNINDVVEQTFTAYVLENDYIQVMLVPEYGGRIISLIDKTTGNEQLYQNPLGLPYGIGDGNFYYDWLMVYGGIFPTFPAPEHGKSWFLPWSFEVITEETDEITVRMGFVDDVTFQAAPGRFNPAPTGLEAEYLVSLKAGHRALDTTLTLSNPTDETVRYEYWTCVTLAPGSATGDTQATLSTEIIAPIDQIKMPPWWPQTIAAETATNMPDIYQFDALRIFDNWADMGIAYAYPTMNGANFWGAINQDNQEGLIRIADNTITPGLKIWTWGAESADLPADIYAFNERRPYIELWAGVTPEFFQVAFLPAGESVTIIERYVVTTGLSNITHASDDVLVNVYQSDAGEIRLALADTQPERPLTVVITADETGLADVELISGIDSELTVPLPDGITDVAFTVSAVDGEVLLAGALDVVAGTDG